tara:strand:- start:1917 stop:2555 length:639 start_codon:yes stop_codon:yes gene_type:complete
MPKKGKKPKETADTKHKKITHSMYARELDFTDAQYTEYKKIKDEKIPKKLVHATPGKERAAWNELRCFIDAADPLLHKKIQMSGEKEAITRRAFGIRGLPFPEEVIKKIAEKGRLTAPEFLNTIKTRMNEIETIAKQSSSSEQSNLTNSGHSYLTGSEGEISTPPPSPPPSPRKAQSTKPSGKKKPSKNKSPKKKPTKRKKPRRQRRTGKRK